MALCEVIRSPNGDMTMIVTDDPALLHWGGRDMTYVVPKVIYQYVLAYVEATKQWLEPLMRSESPGTVFYWENNYHDKIRNFLHDISGYEPRHISNVLCALGY